MPYTYGTEPSHFVEIPNPRQPGQPMRPGVGHPVQVRSMTGVGMPGLVTGALGYFAAVYDEPAVEVRADGASEWKVLYSREAMLGGVFELPAGWGENATLPERLSVASLDAVYATRTTLATSALAWPVSAGKAGADTRQQALTLPALYDHRVLIADDASGTRTVDGAKYFTCIEVGSKPGTWLAQWYGYVAGHDSARIWLVTAPAPEGPWTWVEPVIGIGGASANMTTALYDGHISSPDALWVDGQISLYYHGRKFGTGAPNAFDSQQPTGLARSANGRTFTDIGYMLPTTRTTNEAVYWQGATSYARVFRDGRVFRAVWQSEFTRGWSTEVGVVGAAYSVGNAVSLDGQTWRYLPALIGNAPGDRGPFSPSVVRLGDGSWLMFLTWKPGASGETATRVQVWHSRTFEPGSWYRLGNLVEGDTGTELIQMSSPLFLYRSGELKVIYGQKLTNAIAQVKMSTVRWGL